MDPAMSPPTMRLAGLVFCFAIAVLATYLAFDFAGRVRTLRSGLGWRWLLGAAAALGTGLWSMHVVGIATRPVPDALAYHPGAAVGIWLGSMLAALAGLAAVSGRPLPVARIVAGAAWLGLAVGSAVLIGLRVSRLSLGA